MHIQVVLLVFLDEGTTLVTFYLFFGSLCD